VTYDDGTVEPLEVRGMLSPLERALRAMSWGMVALAAAMAVSRFT
jgi:hypothetical protein